MFNVSYTVGLPIISKSFFSTIQTLFLVTLFLLFFLQLYRPKTLCRPFPPPPPYDPEGTSKQVLKNLIINI